MAFLIQVGLNLFDQILFNLIRSAKMMGDLRVLCTKISPQHKIEQNRLFCYREIPEPRSMSLYVINSAAEIDTKVQNKLRQRTPARTGQQN